MAHTDKILDFHTTDKFYSCLTNATTCLNSDLLNQRLIKTNVVVVLLDVLSACEDLLNRYNAADAPDDIMSVLKRVKKELSRSDL